MGGAGVRSPWEESSLPSCEGRHRRAAEITHGSICWAPSWCKHHTGLARVLGRMCVHHSPPHLSSMLLLPWAVSLTAPLPTQTRAPGSLRTPPLQRRSGANHTPSTAPRHVLHCPVWHAPTPTPTPHLLLASAPPRGQLVVLNQQASR